MNRCRGCRRTISVIPLPGANAALTALIASGLATQPFYFYGFLQREIKRDESRIRKITKNSNYNNIL